MTFGQRLAAAREEAGLTQEELARKLYVTRQGLSRWENGKTQPSIETLGLICNVLDKPPAYFIEVKEEIGRRQYRELSFSERMVAIEGFIKNRCRLVRINYFLLEMVSIIGVFIIGFFATWLNNGVSLAAWAIGGGVALVIAAFATWIMLSLRYSALYNAYLLSELNVVRISKLF